MAKVNKRSAVITVGGTDYTAQLAKSVVTSAEADSDFVTFADAAAGGARQYVWEFIAPQDHETTSLWDKVWSVPGTTLAVIYKPQGNAVASLTQPHYSFNAIVTEPDGDFLGGEADKSPSAVQTIECAWPLTARPTKITS